MCVCLPGKCVLPDPEASFTHYVVDIYEADGYVESVGFPHEYPTDVTYQYNLHQPEGSNMTLMFEAFNVTVGDFVKVGNQLMSSHNIILYWSKAHDVTTGS
jgi:hypothetical protein